MAVILCPQKQTFEFDNSGQVKSFNFYSIKDQSYSILHYQLHVFIFVVGLYRIVWKENNYLPMYLAKCLKHNGPVSGTTCFPERNDEYRNEIFDKEFFYLLETE